MSEFQGISLPKKLLKAVDEKVDGYNYLNKTEFIRVAIREKIQSMGGN